MARATGTGKPGSDEITTIRLTSHEKTWVREEAARHGLGLGDFINDVVVRDWRTYFNTPPLFVEHLERERVARKLTLRRFVQDILIREAMVLVQNNPAIATMPGEAIDAFSGAPKTKKTERAPSVEVTTIRSTPDEKVWLKEEAARHEKGVADFVRDIAMKDWRTYYESPVMFSNALEAERQRRKLSMRQFVQDVLVREALRLQKKSETQSPSLSDTDSEKDPRNRKT